MYATNADIPTDVQKRFPSSHCQDIWRQTWNDTMDRHHDEGRAFATAETAGQNCNAANKSTKAAMPQTQAAMQDHMAADLPGGHATDCADMAMPECAAMHDAMHAAGAGHTHPSMKSADEFRVLRAVKFVAPDTIEGLAMPFDSYDTDTETFTKSGTDFCDEWFGKSGRPLLYDHGLDADQTVSIIGRQVEYEDRAEGRWAQSQLGRNVRYRKAIDALIEEGALGYSSGAMAHLAKKNAQNVITRWPWVELSLTPIPAHPGTLGVHYVKSSDFIRRLEATDEQVPAPLKAALAAMDEWADTRDDDSLPDGLKFADLIDRLSVDGPAWIKARRDWNVKSGRVLSAATRERLTAHPTALRQLADDLDELLTSADAPSAAKAALWSAVLEAEASLARASLKH